MIAAFRPRRAAATATLAVVPPRILAEGLNVLQPDADLQRVDVDATATEGEHLQRLSLASDGLEDRYSLLSFEMFAHRARCSTGMRWTASRARESRVRAGISDARSFEIEIGPHCGSRSTVLAWVNRVNTLYRQMVIADCNDSDQG